MANMSYVRFQNTVIDLQDCLDHIDDDDLSPKETRARARLVNLCRQIVGLVEDGAGPGETIYADGDDPMY